MIDETLQYLYEHWARMCLFMAIFMSLPLIFFFNQIGSVAFWIWIQTPLYLLHQFEEHFQGGFKKFINQRIFKIMDADFPLNDKLIFWINIPFIWIMFPLVAIISVSHPAWGILLPIFAITNASLHFIGFFALKFTYNPGFLVSTFLNIPLGLYTIGILTSNNVAGGLQILLAIIVAILSHILIFIPARLRYLQYQNQKKK